jgi:hypothetical protein
MRECWGVSEWGIRTEEELKVLGYALGNRRFSARWDRYQAWVDTVGEQGVV